MLVCGYWCANTIALPLLYSTPRVFLLLLLLLFWWNPFIPSRNLDEVFNDVAIMCLRIFPSNLPFPSNVPYVKLPCYLVPSSRNRPLATSMVAILHPALSLASSRIFIISLERYFCILSSQVQCGLPLPRRPSILPSIICNNIISDLTTCPKKIGQL